MNNLHVMDSAMLPFSGCFSFLHIDEESAANGIRDAIDHDFLVNRIMTLNAARQLSKLCDREILTGASSLPTQGGSDINVGDAAILCPHLSVTRAEKRRHQLVEEYVFVICMDISSPQGLADKIVTAKPDDMLFPDWMEKLGLACYAEHRIRIDRANRAAEEEN